MKAKKSIKNEENREVVEAKEKFIDKDVEAEERSGEKDVEMEEYRKRNLRRKATIMIYPAWALLKPVSWRPRAASTAELFRSSIKKKGKPIA